MRKRGLETSVAEHGASRAGAAEVRLTSGAAPPPRQTPQVAPWEDVVFPSVCPVPPPFSLSGLSPWLAARSPTCGGEDGLLVAAAMGMGRGSYLLTCSHLLRAPGAEI